MDIQQLSIPDILVITPRKFEDQRGYFMETFRQSVFSEATGRNTEFVQDNFSFSKEKFTVRGLHYQRPPHAQGKLVKCTQGSILDVAVDVRVGSPTYGASVQVVLSSSNAKQLWIPEGFLHGFVTLEPSCVIQYKCTDYYAHEFDGCVMWNDASFDIDWGFDLSQAVLSAKDLAAPSFEDFSSPFKYK